MSEIGSRWFNRKSPKSPLPSENPKRPRRNTIMALEPRMMYDAAAAVTLSAAAHHHHQDGAGDHATVAAAEQSGSHSHRSNSGQGDGSSGGPTSHHHALQNVQTPPPAAEDVKTTSSTLEMTGAAASAGGASSHEVVFIDSRVTGYQVLVNGVKGGVTAVVLDPSRDGLAQIAGYLSAHPDSHPATVDIVAHGAQGELLLGSTTLTDANLPADAAALKQIGEALAPGGAIALYGCNVAGNAAGLQFIADLSKDAGGADVVAATHEVGAVAHGGSWTLDAATGRVLVDTPFTAATLQAFPDLLTAAPTVTADTAPTSYSGGGTAVPIDPGLTVTDPSGTLVGASVQLVGFFNGDTLTINGTTSGAINNGANGTISYAFSGSILTLSGTDTVADYQAALRLVSYGFAGNGDPTVGGANTSRSVYWVVDNGHATNEFFPASQPINNDQPSLGLNQLVVEHGLFPAHGGDTTHDSGGIPLGSIRTFAGSLVPDGTAANGALLAIASNSPLFSILGTNYGGNGVSTFQLPNLQGRLATGFENNPNALLGQDSGADNVTLTTQNMPQRWGGNGIGFNNDQPSQTINYIINTGGKFPGGGSTDVIGAVVPFLGDYAPNGYMLANGQLLGISENQALFAVLGTTYGGDGITTFALPNLTGRTVVGAGDDTRSTNAVPVGTVTGQDTTKLTTSNLPFPAGGSQPVSNDQPSLAMTYLVAIEGVFPSSSAAPDPMSPYLGEVIAFAGTGGALANMLGHGWAVADGQTLAISQYQALFSVLGDTYGGNGTSSFALPDLIGRSVAGVGTSNLGTTVTLGEQFGSDSFTLNSAETPLPIVATSTLFISHTVPTVSAGATATLVSGGAAVTLDAALTVNDVDSAGSLTGATVTIGSGFDRANDLLHFTGQHNITGSYDAATGVLTLRGTDSIADYQAALDSVSFSSTTSAPGSRSIDWSVSDGVSSSSDVTSSVAITVRPVVTVNGSAGYVERTAGAAIEPALTLADANSADLVGATVTIAGGLQPGDTLHFTDQNGIHGNYDAATGLLTLTGTASVADYQTALRSVSFDNLSNHNPTDSGLYPTRTIDWQVNDGKAVSGSLLGTATSFAVGQGPAAVATGDFNGDGALDLVVANQASNTVSVLLGNGSGGFGPAIDHAVGSAPNSVKAVDLNGDGKLDLVVANTGSDSISVLLGDGNGGFALANNVATGSQPVSVATGDLNGDGRLDLVVADRASNDVTVLFGDGSGAFAAAASVAAGSHPVSIALGDFDGDGRLDIAVLNEFSNDVWVMQGDGSGGFAAAGSFSVGAFPNSMAIGDLNGDGKLDLVTANGNSASVLLGDGHGGFGAANTFIAGAGPSGIAIGDVNGDGRPDLVVTDGGSNSVSVLLGDGSGGFTQLANLPTGTQPDTVAIGDFNGDGQPDLAIANFGAGSISILLGNGNELSAVRHTTISVTAVNDPAVISGVASGTVVEAGGIANGTAGTPSATGLLTDTDPDNPTNTFQAVTTSTAGDQGYGSYVMTASGSWSYTLDNTNAKVQALNIGDSLTDTFTVHTADGSAQLISVTIDGANDAALLSSDTRSLTETNSAADIGSSGQLTISDIDSPATFVAQNNVAGSYGHFSIDANGAWAYSADSAHDEFAAGTTYTDTFKVASADGTTTSVTIDILGTNDAAILSSDTRNLTETNSATDISSSGTLTITDIDSSASFVAQSNTAGSYGHFTLGADGAWTYSADSAHDEFVAGTTYTDTFKVASADGTTTSVTIDILGTNDAAVLSSDARNLTETNSAADISSSGQLTISDIDSPASFVAQSNIAGSYGTFAILADGAWTYTASSAHDEFAAGTTYTDTFSVASADGTTTSVTIHIAGSNDAAIVSNDTRNLTETNSAADISSTGTLTITDVDSPATFVAQTSVAGSYGHFTIGTGGAWTYTADSAHDEFVAGTSHTDIFKVASADGTTTSVTIHIAGTNDAPSASAGNILDFNANAGAPIAIDPAIMVRDVDSSTLASAKVSIGAGFDAANDSLGFVNQRGITGRYDHATGVLTLTGAASVADYQAALASVTFSSITQQNGTRIVQWTVDDGSSQSHLSLPAQTTLNMSGIILPPHLFADDNASTPAPNATPASLLVGSDRSFQPAPAADGDGYGIGGGYGFHVVHTDAVLTTAPDATVQIKLALAALEAPLGGDIAFVVARQADGDPLPDWLTFDPATGSFAGLPPDGAIASIEPDRSADNSIVTGALPPNPNADAADPRAPATANTISVEVMARDSKGNVAATVFTIDLRTHTAGKQGWNLQPLGAERHPSSPTLSPELAAIEAAVREATRPLEPSGLRGMPTDHRDAISVGVSGSLLAGRAGLSEQLASIGWRSMAAQRNALLASLRQSK